MTTGNGLPARDEPRLVIENRALRETIEQLRQQLDRERRLVSLSRQETAMARDSARRAWRVALHGYGARPPR